MTDETRIALKNHRYLVSRYGFDNVRLVWNTDTLLYGVDGWADFDELSVPGFTSATECFVHAERHFLGMDAPDAEVR
ncbi:hypothetical protein EV641_110124 [Rhodococcus sp. SMB37]|uniref:hypothetical protein n=1 Tax=Rhodococcus sp. SMB37 TaxID=2512213 RepID=UPI0006D25B1E|nr:hypothetical protein [Rhodococcus sp. SMB37]TCN51265.1 hypothetical protein EV641_110124 [Rhodococcus sp. SMB37]